jgi:two-component system chemotaxis response regulator CheB
MGVVLTGTLGDGASGLSAPNLCGGMTVVQDPRDAAFPDMPLTALNRTRPDHVVQPAENAGIAREARASAVRQPAPMIGSGGGGVMWEGGLAATDATWGTLTLRS